MRKQITEPDFIGGQGSLTKEEEAALSAYFASKKKKLANGRKPVRRTSKKLTTI